MGGTDKEGGGYREEKSARHGGVQNAEGRKGRAERGQWGGHPPS
jgi:hypothetical protein